MILSCPRRQAGVCVPIFAWVPRLRDGWPDLAFGFVNFYKWMFADGSPKPISKTLRHALGSAAIC